MSSNVLWRFLIIEDDLEIADQLKKDAESGKWLPAPNVINAEIFNSFQDAEKALDNMRYDCIVLDIRNDEAKGGDNLTGLEVYKRIREKVFVPVIFYTAMPTNTIESETAFVKVVEKSEGIKKLRSTIKEVFDTGLPHLTKFIEEEQRSYMWDSVGKHWKDFDNIHKMADITYLMARRLASTLSGCTIRNFLAEYGVPTPGAEEQDKIHPIEMYIWPPIDSQYLSGDILGKKGTEDFWVVLTPSCDLEHSEKVDYVLLTKCSLLKNEKEFEKYFSEKGSKKELERLVKDNRQGQRDRFKFLPATFFLPDLVVDFQNLEKIPLAELEKLQKVASLDSPFAESLIATFARYYGRLGTPDIDVDIVLERINETGSFLG